jgi:hypothetical protein
LYLITAPSSFSQIQSGSEQPKSPAVAAYQKIVFDAIGQRGYSLLERDADLITLGATRVSFSIRADGHVEKLRTISNTSNAAFEKVGYEAIMRARIPAIPPAALKNLPDHRLSVEISFTTSPH